MSGLILPAGIKDDTGGIFPVWNPRSAMDAVKQPAQGLIESASFDGFPSFRKPGASFLAYQSGIPPVFKDGTLCPQRYNVQLNSAPGVYGGSPFWADACLLLPSLGSWSPVHPAPILTVSGPGSFFGLPNPSPDCTGCYVFTGVANGAPSWLRTDGAFTFSWRDVSGDPNPPVIIDFTGCIGGGGIKQCFYYVNATLYATVPVGRGGGCQISRSGGTWSVSDSIGYSYYASALTGPWTLGPYTWGAVPTSALATACWEISNDSGGWYGAAFNWTADFGPTFADDGLIRSFPENLTDEGEPLSYYYPSGSGFAGYPVLGDVGIAVGTDPPLTMAWTNYADGYGYGPAPHVNRAAYSGATGLTQAAPPPHSPGTVGVPQVSLCLWARYPVALGSGFGVGGAGGTIRPTQTLVTLTYSWTVGAAGDFGIDCSMVFAKLLDAPFPDVMALSGLELPLYASFDYLNPFQSPPNDWSGCTATISLTT